jgi:hypothetical protein
MLQQLAELSDDFDALPDVLACYEYEVWHHRPWPKKEAYIMFVEFI